MLQSLKKVCSWVVSLVQAGISWVVDNWPAITAKAEEMGRRAYEVRMDHLRKAVVAFERGMVIGIETVEKRQGMPFKGALAEAKSIVKARTFRQKICRAWLKDKTKFNLSGEDISMAQRTTRRNPSWRARPIRLNPRLNPHQRQSHLAGQRLWPGCPWSRKGKSTSWTWGRACKLKHWSI